MLARLGALRLALRGSATVQVRDGDSLLADAFPHLTVDAVLWRRDARTGALAAFPCVALGAVALGVGWAAALVAP